MKALRIIVPVLFAASLVFTQCDYVTDPEEIPVIPAFDTTRRIALVEEWTGHTCRNCPAAARTIDSMKNVYGERFVAISIHDGFFSYAPPQVPQPCTGGDPNAFTLNMRCATAASYTSAHGNAGDGAPIGMVNRIGMPTDEELKQYTAWPGLVHNLISQDAIASIHIDHTYNTANRQVDVTVRGTWLQTYTGTLNVAIMLTESGTTGWQVDGDNCNPGFVFHDVLRECLNTPGSHVGTQLFTGTTASGTPYSYNLPNTYTLPAAFDPNGCHLVAIIYDTTTGEVMQAWEEALL